MQKYGRIICTGPLTPLGAPVPYSTFGRMAELVDALDSKSCDSNVVRVQVPRRPPDYEILAFFFTRSIINCASFRENTNLSQSTLV